MTNIVYFLPFVGLEKTNKVMKIEIGLLKSLKVKEKKLVEENKKKKW
jgi:hypothetical protein